MSVVCGLVLHGCYDMCRCSFMFYLGTPTLFGGFGFPGFGFGAFVSESKLNAAKINGRGADSKRGLHLRGSCVDSLA